MESPLPAQISEENVLGPRQGLPNGIQVQSGPEQASMPGRSGSNGYVPAWKPLVIAPPPPETTSSPEATSVAKVPTVAVSTADKHASVPPSGYTSATSPESLSIDAMPVKNDEAEASSSTLLPPAQVHVAARPSTFAISSTAPPASSSSSSSPPSPSVAAPATFSAPVPGQPGPVYTSYFTSGREAHEVIVYVEEVTVTATADVPYAKRTPVPVPEPQPAAKIEHHHRRHVHHAAHGIGGQRRR